jgi:phosphoribosylglycinamide formyltransferase-1
MPIVVLLSGGGTNLQAILDARAEGSLPVEIRAVISNRDDAYGLQRARLAGVPTAVLDHRPFAERAAYDARLLALIEDYHPKLVVLAGFMRILTAAFVQRFAGTLINIHPALLPAFRGLDTHRRALQARVREHGASVHFVTEDLDAGPVILQAAVPVLPDDTPETLAARVLVQEHRIYPLAIRWLAEGRLQWAHGQVHLDGAPLPASGYRVRADAPLPA